MKNTIWKFPLQMTDQQEIQMPIGAQILTVQMQGNKPFVWAIVDPKEGLENRIIQVYGTGNPCSADLVTHAYIGTIQMREGSLVFHVFELKQLKYQD